MKNKALAINVLLILIVLTDLTYSFFQHYTMPLDGDIAAGVLKTSEVDRLLEDPFGIKVLSGAERHVNPNRFFAHWSFYSYFSSVPFFFQTFSDPVDSVYLSAATVKIIVQAGFLLLVSLCVYKMRPEGNFPLQIPVLLTCFFQTLGFERYIGIIDQSVTYTFFYALPLLFLLLYFFLLLTGFTRFHALNLIVLLSLSIVLPFSGPLIPGAVILGSLCILGYKYFNISANLNRRLSKTDLVVIAISCLLSAYSLYLGTFNTLEPGTITIVERYSRLLIGIYEIISQSPAYPVMITLLFVNVYLIDKTDRNGKIILNSIKWFGVFAILYLLLLPFGGFREYRPNIVRYDTIMPVTIGLILSLGASGWHIMNMRLKTPFLYRSLLASVIIYFTFMDQPDFGRNACEKQMISRLSASPADTVALDCNCNVISWAPIRDPKQSEQNGELLRFWNITDRKLIYYQECE